MSNLYAGERSSYGIGRIFLLHFLMVALPLLLKAQPSISSFTPTGGGVGATVTITGTNFNTTPAANIVFFGSVRASVTAATSTTLAVTVPSGASYQPLTVTTGGLTASSALPFTTLFTDPSQFNAAAFADRTDIRTGSGPQGIASADFDGDGKPDLAIANGDSNSISVFRNAASTTSMSFGLQYYHLMAGGDYPAGVTTGDLDGDGKPDLIVINNVSSTIALFRNISTIGSISFAAPVYYNVDNGGFPSVAVIADLNGDGKPEIAVAASGLDVVSIYSNNSSTGTFSFSTNPDLHLPAGDYPFGIVVGDFDGDGKPDLATENFYANNVSIFRNTGSAFGTISFASHVDFSTGVNPGGLSAVDLDKDGKIDLAVTNYSDNSVSLLRNTSTTGSPSFVSAATLTMVNPPQGIAVADLDGDGKPDLAVTNIADGKVCVFRNTSTSGNVSMAAGINYSVGAFPQYVAAVDLDGDGTPDLISTNYSDNSISILRNKGSQGPPIIPATPSIHSFTPASGTNGTTVSISGTGLAVISSVTFAGVNASSFSVRSDTLITAIVGAGATGKITVAGPNGVDSLGTFTYTVAPSPPPGAMDILSFYPPSGKTGDGITINGHHFLGTTTFTFGGVPAQSIIVISDSVMIAFVGNGASGQVLAGGTSGVDSMPGFTYLSTIPPTTIPSVYQITSFYPTSGTAGTSVTIIGSHFTGASVVSFGATPAASFRVSSDSTITAIVSEGSSGLVRVTSSGWQDSLAGFTYLADTVVTPPPPTTPPAQTANFQLLQFEGALSGNQVLLQWTARNDNKIAYYVIERGTDSLQFSILNSVSPITKDGSTHNYSYLDLAPSSGKNFYRVKMVDATTAISYGPTIDVQIDGKPTNKLTVYPNPIKYGFTLVEVPATSRSSRFLITDMSGKVVRVQEVNPNTLLVRVDVPGLIKGTYKLIWSDGVKFSYQSILVLQ